MTNLIILCSTSLQKSTVFRTQRALERAVMDDGTPVNPQCETKVTREESTPQSLNNTLGGFHEVMYTLMALLIGLKDAKGMEILTTLLVADLLFYFGLMHAAKELPAYYPVLRDFGPFINKISKLFGILALIFSVLIIVLAYGSLPLFLWCMFMGSVLVAVVVLIGLYWTWFYDGSKVAEQPALERSASKTEHEAQDQNQIINEPPV